MKHIDTTRWTWATWIGILFSLAIAICFIAHLLLHKDNIPFITYGTLALGGFIFTKLSLSDNIPDRQLVHTTWIIVLIVFIIPWCVYDFEKKIDGDYVQFILNYCAIIASSFSIIFVCYTLKLQRQQLRDSNRLTEQMRDKEILKMIDDFLSPEMTRQKELCTQLKEKLHTNPQAIIRMLSYAFERSIYDDCHSDPLWPAFRHSSGYAQYAAFIRLARFFNLISVAPLSETTARSIHFYYVWWRQFLLEVTQIYNHAWNQTIPGRRLVSFKAAWTGACDRLDEILTRYQLPIE